MKKSVLILMGMFMMVSTTEAINGNKTIHKTKINYHVYNNAVTFNENGIAFHVFLNGDFDFNTQTAVTYYNYNGYRTKRSVRVGRDYNGRVISVGHVFIDYDHRGNVTCIGDVFMTYNRGFLSSVGNLRIKYNRWGKPNFYGQVYNYEPYYNTIGTICDYNDAYFYRPEFRRNYRLLREDQNFYYYRAQPNAKIGKRSLVLKRRKVASNYYKNKKSKRNRGNTSRRKHRSRNK